MLPLHPAGGTNRLMTFPAFQLVAGVERPLSLRSCARPPLRHRMGTRVRQKSRGLLLHIFDSSATSTTRTRPSTPAAVVPLPASDTHGCLAGGNENVTY